MNLSSGHYIQKILKVSLDVESVLKIRSQVAKTIAVYRKVRLLVNWCEHKRFKLGLCRNPYTPFPSSNNL